MPDPIHCSLDPSQSISTYACEELVIGSAEAEPTVVAPGDGQPEPAVSQLMESVTTRVIQPPEASLGDSWTSAGAECLSELDSMLILFAGSAKTPLTAALGGLKVGLDLGECISEGFAEADKKAAEQYCIDRGDTVVGWQDNELTCERRVTR